MDWVYFPWWVILIGFFYQFGYPREVQSLLEGFYVDRFQLSSVDVLGEDFSLDFFERFLIVVFLFSN